MPRHWPQLREVLRNAKAQTASARRGPGGAAGSPRQPTCRHAARTAARCGAARLRPCAAWRPTTIRTRPRRFWRVYDTLPPGERRDALTTLCSRTAYAKALLAAVAAKQVAVAGSLGRFDPAIAELQGRGSGPANRRRVGHRSRFGSRQAPANVRIPKVAGRRCARATRPGARPRDLRQDLPAMPHTVRHGRQDRARPNRFEPSQSGLSACRTSSTPAPSWPRNTSRT